MKEINALRKEIDFLDETLVHILAARLDKTQKLQKLKKATGLPLVDLERTAKREKRLAEIAIEAGLEAEMALEISRLIAAASPDPTPASAVSSAENRQG